MTTARQVTHDPDIILELNANEARYLKQLLNGNHTIRNEPPLESRHRERIFNALHKAGVD